MPFDYTSGNPDNLTAGTPARMQDIQGPFYDIRTWLNSATGGGGGSGGFVNAGTANAPVLDVGMLGQVRAGRQLANADFTSMGLQAPLGLWNLGDLTDVSGNGRALTNKGAVPFGVGVNGLASTAAVFAGSTGQALFIADTGASDPFRIRTGSFGCWTRTAKRGVGQVLISKWSVAGQLAWWLGLTGTLPQILYSGDGTSTGSATGVSDVYDDRWHHIIGTHDGTMLRLYVDGVLEAAAATSATIFAGSGALNIGAQGADGSTAAASPHYGRVDEAFVTADILSDDQVRGLYCAKLLHTLGATPTRARLNVRRRKRGGPFVVADFPSSPVRLHNFTAGSLADEGTGGVALTNNGTAVSVAGADGAPGGAFSFAGAQSLSSTDAGLPAGTAARSYGCWFKTATVVQTGVLISWGTLASNHITLYQNGSGQLVSVNGGDTITGPFEADGQWHFGVVTEDNAAGDGVRRKLYCDGRLVGGSTVLNSITLAGANRFRVGANADATSPFTGQIDGAFVHSVALTFEQVAKLYAVGSQALPASPKEEGAHIEAWDSAAVYATFDSLDSTAQIDLGVAA